MRKRFLLKVTIVAVLILIIFTLVRGYNSLIIKDEGVKKSWAQVETQLQRRADLIPSLVNTVKGYAKHEKEIFINIAEARAKLAGARSLEDKVKYHTELGYALSRLLAIVENYPTLKADQTFIRLQDELAGTENRIAVERRRYNETVADYNITVRRFPTNIIARIFNFTVKPEYFEAKETAAEPPRVEF